MSSFYNSLPFICCLALTLTGLPQIGSAFVPPPDGEPIPYANQPQSDLHPSVRPVQVPVYEQWKGGKTDQQGDQKAVARCEWRYIGCYELRKGKMGTLTEEVDLAWISTSPKTCTSECRHRGFKFAAVGGAGKKSLYCYCGQEFSQTKLLSGCDEPCPDNTMEKCGNWNRASIYKCTNPEIAPSRPVCLQWNDLGCYNLHRNEDQKPVMKGQGYSVKGRGAQGRRQCQSLCAKMGHVRSGYLSGHGNCLCGPFLQYSPEKSNTCSKTSTGLESSIQISSCVESNFQPFLADEAMTYAF